jgi:hypothetical protein
LREEQRSITRLPGTTAGQQPEGIMSLQKQEKYNVRGLSVGVAPPASHVRRMSLVVRALGDS